MEDVKAAGIPEAGSNASQGQPSPWVISFPGLPSFQAFLCGNGDHPQGTDRLFHTPLFLFTNKQGSPPLTHTHRSPTHQIHTGVSSADFTLRVFSWLHLKF